MKLLYVTARLYILCKTSKHLMHFPMCNCQLSNECRYLFRHSCMHVFVIYSLMHSYYIRMVHPGVIILVHPGDLE